MDVHVAYIEVWCAAPATACVWSTGPAELPGYVVTVRQTCSTRRDVDGVNIGRSGATTMERVHDCATTRTFFPVRLSKQRAKGASQALMSIYNPLTYRTIRICFVLICYVVYLHLRYLLVLCCVNSRLRTPLTIPCCPSVNGTLLWV